MQIILIRFSKILYYCSKNKIQEHKRFKKKTQNNRKGMKKKKKKKSYIFGGKKKTKNKSKL